MQRDSDETSGSGYHIERVRFLPVAGPASPEQATQVELEWTYRVGESVPPQRTGYSAGGPCPHVDRDLARRLRRVLSPPGTESPSLDSLEWPGSLMPFQEDGVRALIASDRLLLADDMGLGKTLQVIAALRILRHQGDIRFALVAAPASLLDQWRGELRKWAP